MAPPNEGPAIGGHPPPHLGIVKHGDDHPSEVVRIARRMKPARLFVIEQLGKRAMGRGDDRHPRGQRLDHGNSFRLGENSGHGEEVNRCEEGQLTRPIKLAEPGHVLGHAEVAGGGETLRDIAPFGIDDGAGGAKRCIVLLPHERQRPHEEIESFLRAGPGE